ncbi:MAG TPA: AgmX/PglI C-terminal domain-containing protein, partial [Polyangiaceae bacterium]|nr:AgmX/PglI C-terminal domain-containing protein [Polyangiaceae bacterium]
DRLRACYEAALARNSKLRGKLSARFTITVDGSVTNAELAGASVPDEAFQTCFVEEFGKLRFGAPPNGSVTVTYPIDFSPGDDAPRKK